MTDTPELKTDGTPKRPRGRKPKLSQARIDVANKVLKDPMNVMAWTIEGIFHEINRKLDKQQQMSYAAYRDYKNGRAPTNPEYKHLFEEFSSLHKTAEQIAERNMIKGIYEGDKRQGKAFLAERRFRKKRSKDDNKTLNVHITNKQEIDQEQAKRLADQLNRKIVEGEIIEPKALENTEEPVNN